MARIHLRAAFRRWGEATTASKTRSSMSMLSISARQPCFFFCSAAFPPFFSDFSPSLGIFNKTHLLSLSSPLSLQSPFLHLIEFYERSTNDLSPSFSLGNLSGAPLSGAPWAAPTTACLNKEACDSSGVLRFWSSV